MVESDEEIPALPWFLLRGAWSRRKRLGGWLLPLELLGIAALVSAGGYLVVLYFNVWRGVTVWDPSLPLDRAIPFLPWSIYVYSSLYIYSVLPIFTTPRDDRGLVRLLYLFKGCLAVSLFSFALFLLLPCEIELVYQIREQGYGYEGVSGFLFRELHRVDRPWNAWPSLHVSLSLMIVLHVSREMGRFPSVRWILTTHWALLALSITTTKQHHVFDLLTGALLGWLGWVWLVRPGLRYAETAEVVGPPES